MIPTQSDSGTPPSLILDFLRWLEPCPRPYAEAMEAWRTSCPRLTIWEDAIDAGYVARERVGGGEAMVVLTTLGRAELNALRPPGSPRRW